MQKKEFDSLIKAKQKIFLGRKDWKSEDFPTIKFLGKGSFAKVIKSRIIDGDIKIPLALKKLSKFKMKQERVENNLEIEVSVMYKLEHPNILKLYTHFEDPENVTLVLEFSKNGDLFNLINNYKGLPEVYARDFFKQTFSAIKYLHEQDPVIIHRDIKPENILLDRDFNVKIADFGWASNKYGKRVTFCGTTNYMAPEILLKSGYNKSIDIWALGVLLFELNSGYPPFMESAEIENDYAIRLDIEEKIINNKPLFPCYFPPELCDLITRMLEKEECDRITEDEILVNKWFNGNSKKFEIRQNKKFKFKKPEFKSLLIDKKSDKYKEILEEKQKLHKDKTLNKISKSIESSILMNEPYISIYKDLEHERNTLKQKIMNDSEEIRRIRLENNALESLYFHQSEIKKRRMEKLDDIENLKGKTEMLREKLKELEKSKKKRRNSSLDSIPEMVQGKMLIEELERILEWFISDGIVLHNQKAAISENEVLMIQNVNFERKTYRHNLNEILRKQSKKSRKAKNEIISNQINILRDLKIQLNESKLELQKEKNKNFYAEIFQEIHDLNFKAFEFHNDIKSFINYTKELSGETKRKASKKVTFRID